MHTLPPEVAMGGEFLISGMILLIAVAFVVVVSVVASRCHKTHPSTQTGTKSNNQKQETHT